MENASVKRKMGFSVNAHLDTAAICAKLTSTIVSVILASMVAPALIN